MWNAGFRIFTQKGIRSIIGLLCWYSAFAAGTAQTATPQSEHPLPAIATLMQAVEDHQKASEALIRNYIYTSKFTQVETDGSGHPKKTETREADIFYVDNVRLMRLLTKDGKPLDEKEQKKQSERIDKEIAKAREGKQKNPDEVSYARFLELGTFSNERRLPLRGRPTIALDYTGNPKAKTSGPVEGVIHELSGTVYIDEHDQAMSRVEGHFANNFKIAGGLAVNIAEGTSFWADSTKVNNEVWLPSSFHGEGSARVLIFFNLHGSAFGTNSNFRKFKSGATILPGLTEVPDTTTPAPSPTPR